MCLNYMEILRVTRLSSTVCVVIVVRADRATGHLMRVPLGDSHSCSNIYPVIFQRALEQVKRSLKAIDTESAMQLREGHHRKVQQLANR
jgi:hypothetical protein